MCVGAALVATLMAWLGHAHGETACGKPRWGEEPLAKGLERRFVFDTVKASDRGDISYEVSIAPCGRALCPIEVRLRDGDGVRDRLELDVCGPAAGPIHNVTGAILDSIAGTSYPTGVDRHAPGWFVLGADGQLSLFVQRIRLTANLRGVLLHVHSMTWSSKRHYLIVASGRRLKLAWTAPDAEVSGRTGDFDRYVRVTVLNYGDLEAIYYFRGIPINFMISRVGETWRSRPGEAEAAVYRWDAGMGMIEELSIAEAGVAIYAVVYATFESADEAWATPPEGAKCLMPKFFVATDRFPELEPGNVMFADFNWREDVAVRRLEAYKKACTHPDSSAKAFVAKLTAFPAVHE